MRDLPQNIHDPNLLVGYQTSDDAGVYRITDEIAMIQTLDYFTPVVDDPYMFGQIAAANALSDVYAMGGTPKTALNIVGYPIKELGPEILNQILSGAIDKVKEAGAVIVGGHSIDDQEPKFGLSVTGFIHPDRIWKNVGAIPGDVLVLTKPIGVGILTTAIKREKASPEQEKEVTSIMSMLNKEAALVLQDFHPNAVTDVTGFGLLGHAFEMALGSNVSFMMYSEAIPVLSGTYDLANEGIIPGGSKSNHQWLLPFVHYEEALTISEQLVLCDAITSGGLLVSMPEKDAHLYVKELNKRNIHSAIIGQVVEKKEKAITVKKQHAN
ncbi:Selenide, water dikinase [Bacillus sp. THAF10]|nr:Selenide, water dikinase [Bacillus sp. THAF10]